MHNTIDLLKMMYKRRIPDMEMLLVHVFKKYTAKYHDPIFVNL